MTRINLEEIKGITADRKKSACAAGDNAAGNEEEIGVHNCKDGKCRIDWHED